MKKVLSILTLALMMTGAVAMACDTCGCKEKKAEKKAEKCEKKAEKCEKKAEKKCDGEQKKKCGEEKKECKTECEKKEKSE